MLDILVQSQRRKHAAKKCFRKVLKGFQYVPRVIIPDKLKRSGAAKRVHYARKGQATSVREGTHLE